MKNKNNKVIFIKKYKCDGRNKIIRLEKYKENALIFIQTIDNGFEIIEYESSLYYNDSFKCLLEDIKNKIIIPFNNSYDIHIFDEKANRYVNFKYNITKKFLFGNTVYLTINGACGESGNIIVSLKLKDIDNILSKLE